MKVNGSKFEKYKPIKWYWI